MLGNYHYKYIILAACLLANSKAYFAEEKFNRVSNIAEVTNAETISNFFKLNPSIDRFLWTPYLGKFKRFEIIIPRRDFFIAEKFKDSSDLYYVSKIIEKDLDYSYLLQSEVDFEITPNKSQILYKKPITYNLSFGGEFIYDDELLIGGNISYEYIMNFPGVIHLNSTIYDKGSSKFEIGSIFLTKDEKGEFFTKATFNKNLVSENFSIGKTWFDVNDTFDITTSYNEKNDVKKFSFFYDQELEEYRFYVGTELNKISDKFEMHIGFSRTFGRKKDKKYNINIKNKDLDLKPKSLKNIRYQELSKIWKKDMQF